MKGYYMEPSRKKTLLAKKRRVDVSRRFRDMSIHLQQGVNISTNLADVLTEERW